MSKLMSVVTLAAVSGFAFASPAFAGDKTKAKMKDAPTKTMTVVKESTQLRNTDMVVQAATEVRSAVARGEYEAVEGPNGVIFYNRVIPVSQLPDPELKLRTLETSTYTHNGVTYTNKVVQPIN